MPSSRAPAARASQATRTPPIGAGPAAGPGGAAPASLAAAMGLALAAPFLLAWNQPPSPTFLNQALALAGWFVVVIGLSRWLPERDLLYRGGLDRLWWALGLLVLAALMSPVWAGLPWAMSLASAGMLLATGLAASTGAAVSQAQRAAVVFRPLAAVLVAAGVASSAVALVQIYAPAWADGSFIARSTVEGRAVGNLRQANHLASLLLWAMVGLVALAEFRWRRPAHDAAYAPTQLDSRWAASAGPGARPWALPRRRASEADRERWQVLALAAPVLALLCAGLVLSGSRTGYLGVLLLAAWAVLDRRLSRPARGLLLAAPLLTLVFSWALAASADPGSVAAARAHLRTGSDISSSRFAIWSNTLALIAQEPWLGVGWGEFNFAWTLTPFPNRPGAFFDHTHNLPLQLMVELGVPLALVVMALLLWTLERAARQAAGTEGEQGLAIRAAFVMVLTMVLHSQLEYPLWYAYFLLPTGFLLGLCIAGRERRSAALRPDDFHRQPVRTSLMAAVIGLAVTLAAVWDYQRVVEIFRPGPLAAPLDQRIATGRQSWFFSHHADYAAVTTAERPSTFMPAFDRAAHHLLDVRLMRAWAQALDETNQIDRARHLAQRLAEFRNPQAADFFAVCADAVASRGRPGDAGSAPAGGTSALPDPATVVGAEAAGPGAARGPGGSVASAARGAAVPGASAPAVAAGRGGSWVEMAASFPAPVPVAGLPKGPATVPADPAFVAPAAAPFQCLKPTRALGYLDFR